VRRAATPPLYWHTMLHVRSHNSRAVCCGLQGFEIGSGFLVVPAGLFLDLVPALLSYQTCPAVQWRSSVHVSYHVTYLPSAAVCIAGL
jgi:hypothetical protein